MWKRKQKSTISNYNDLLLVKEELRSGVLDSEESFRSDIAFAGDVIKAFKISISKKKSKQERKFFKDSLMVLFDDLFVKFLQPYAKNNKQKQVYIPLISIVFSYFIADRLSNKFNSSKKGK